MNFAVAEYHTHERNSSQLLNRALHPGRYSSYDEAVAVIQRMLNASHEQWKVKGYNEEQDYFWARDERPTTRRRVLRVERT
ncbi:UNVERIFIED_ORG: hypothetical protein J2W74_005220 [Methylorubrum zatmanii]